MPDPKLWIWGRSGGRGRGPSFAFPQLPPLFTPFSVLQTDLCPLLPSLSGRSPNCFLLPPFPPVFWRTDSIRLKLQDLVLRPHPVVHFSLPSFEIIKLRNASPAQTRHICYSTLISPSPLGESPLNPRQEQKMRRRKTDFIEMSVELLRENLGAWGSGFQKKVKHLHYSKVRNNDAGETLSTAPWASWAHQGWGGGSGEEGSGFQEAIK